MADLRPVADVGANKLKIFISYRRSDTEGYAGRLYEALRRRFGAANIFMDVDTLRPGQDFVEALETAVARCDVLLAVIGRDWLSAESHDGTRRLDDEFDYIRLEIASALASNKHVIPVLFGDARMPHSAELPEPLQPLARRHAMAIRHDRFKSDSADLVAALRRLQVEKAADSERGRAEPMVNTDAGRAQQVEAEREAEAERLAEAELQTEIARQAEAERQAEIARQAEAEDRRELATLVEGLPKPDLRSTEPAWRGYVLRKAVRFDPDSRVGWLLRWLGRSSVRRIAVVAGVPTVGLALLLISVKPFAAPCDGRSGVPSPTGKFTLFRCPPTTTTSSVSSDADLWIISAGGPRGPIRNITNSAEVRSNPSWHPSDDVILFETYLSDGTAINTIRPDGTDLKRLTDDQAGEITYGNPVWSPDGSLIAFERTDTSLVNPTGDTDIWVMDSSGGSQGPVVDGPERDSRPVWVDVDSIEFHRYDPDAGASDSYTVNVDGSDLHPS